MIYSLYAFVIIPSLSTKCFMGCYGSSCVGTPFNNMSHWRPLFFLLWNNIFCTPKRACQFSSNAKGSDLGRISSRNSTGFSIAGLVRLTCEIGWVLIWEGRLSQTAYFPTSSISWKGPNQLALNFPDRLFLYNDTSKVSLIAKLYRLPHILVALNVILTLQTIWLLLAYVNTLHLWMHPVVPL